MKDIERDKEGRDASASALTAQVEGASSAEKQANERCSICRRHTRFSTTLLTEPAGVPEPRQTWTLCKRCHAALQIEMYRSPVLSPLRLRIAIGIVAAERSPDAYAPTRKPFNDHTLILVMAWGFVAFMLLHLVLIVMLAFVAGH